MTQVAAKISGVWRAVLPWVRQGGIWKPCVAAHARSGGVWEQPFESFSASASRSSMVRIGTTLTLTTAAVTITPSGGASPYTYAWTLASGSTLISATSPASAVTEFTATATLGQALDAVFHCTVTDTNGHSVVVAVAVHLERIFVG